MDPDLKGVGLENFLDSMKLDPFKEEEGAVNLDPGINIEEKFAHIALPC